MDAMHQDGSLEVKCAVERCDAFFFFFFFSARFVAHDDHDIRSTRRRLLSQVLISIA